jgi:hypothetical protein
MGERGPKRTAVPVFGFGPRRAQPEFCWIFIKILKEIIGSCRVYGRRMDEKNEYKSFGRFGENRHFMNRNGNLSLQVKNV